MIFSRKYPVRILVIGTGGTGGYVVPSLYRLVWSLDQPRPVEIILADGDNVEERNLVRQNFVEDDVGRNKAEVLAYRYAGAFGIRAVYIPGYIEDDDRLFSMFSDRDVPEAINIIIGAVDNNCSRQMCHRVFNRLRNIIYINSGNGEYTGQMVYGIRKKGRTRLRPVAEIYPEMLEENDLFKSQEGCGQTVVTSPQSMAANIMAATIILLFLNNILTEGRLGTHSATFSTQSINVKPKFIGK